jgi:phosphate transport system substrate-binding protein
MKPTRRAFALTIVVALAGAGTLGYRAVAAEQITGAGSTFVYPVLSKWSSDYSKSNGLEVNYQSIGSGGGIAQIKAGTVDFGASDAPLSPEDLKAAGLAQFPVIVGGIVPVVNLEGIQAGQIKLDGTVLADIFLGKVKTWNDPAIAALNSGVKLPSSAITVVHRSDGSGTTYNFADYLSKVSPEWKSGVGRGTSIKWPVGIGGKGNEGVAAYVNQVKGSIGYVEYAYVLQNKMTYTLLQNAAGTFMKPSTAAFQAAAASADWAHAQDFDLVMTNAPGKDAYPIAASTFVLMHQTPKNAPNSRAALAFFKWALEHGQKDAESLDYVPLPPPLVSQIEAYWAQNIKTQ